MTVNYYLDKSDTSSYIRKVYYENGKVKNECQILSEKFVGEKRSFFESGNLKRIEKLFGPTSIDDSAYDCLITNFRNDGTKESSYSYVNDKIHGLSMDYDSTGRMTWSGEFINGKLTGKEIEYYKTGTPKSIGYIMNDTLRGFLINFKENGDTLKWFHNGEFGVDGIFYKKWLDSGLILTGSYGDSLRSFVIWHWLNKSNKTIKTKIQESKNQEYIAPE